MSAADHLPEELIEQILYLCLAPPAWTTHDYFIDDGVTLRARICGLRTPVLLQVSRTWYRIGAPLLYAAVALTRPSHIRGVASALQRVPGLGRAVRTLWLEPDFPKELLDVVKRTPNVDTLYLSVQFDVRDRINGLRNALPLMNPKTVVLAGLGRKWQNALRTEAVIAHCIRKEWGSLTKIWLNASNLSSSMLHAVQHAPSLHEFAAPISSAWNWLYTRYGQPGVLVNIAMNPTLEVVHVIARDSWNLKHWEFEVREAHKRVAQDANAEQNSLEQVLGVVQCVVLTDPRSYL